MITDEVETEPNTTTNPTIVENINYNECCLFGDETVNECGPTASRESYRLMN